MSPVGPQWSRMDRLLEILNSMRNNSVGVDGQLSSFMEEAQTSTQSEESLAQIVSTIYGKALSDRSFAATAARLCDKMALFMVEGTKFRSLLLNMLQVRWMEGVGLCGWVHVFLSTRPSVFQCVCVSGVYLSGCGWS